MTVDITNVYKVYTVTREEAGEVYPITFPYISPEYVKCYYAVDKVQTELKFGTEYTVNAETNELTVTNALPVGAQVVVYRVTDCTQEIDWVDGQSVYTPDIEQADDKLTHIVQELFEQVNRAVKITRQAEAAGEKPEERWDEIQQECQDVLDSASVARDEAQRAEESARQLNEELRGTLQEAQELEGVLRQEADEAKNSAYDALNAVASIKGMSAEATTIDYPNAATARWDAEAKRLFFEIPQGKPGENGKDGVDGQDGVGINGKDGVDGLPPDHRWDGTILQFQKPDGTWGQGINLQGQVGPQGQAPTIDVIDCGGACDFKLSQISAGTACSFTN